METRSEYVKTQPQIAEFLDVGLGSIANLIDSGIVVEARNRWGAVIKGRWDLLASTVGYIRFLRTRKADKSPEQLEFERVRNQKAAAQAEQEQIRLAQIKGELHSTAAILALIGPQHVAFRQKMLAIPAKTARLLAAESDHLAVQKVLTAEIKEALAELVGFAAGGSGKNGRGLRVRQNAIKARRTRDKRRKAQ